MNKSIFVVALLALLAAVVMAQGPVVLTADNFEAETEGKTAFVKFYAPWCGHCVALSPTWDSLASKVHGNIDDTKIGKVDCTVEQELGAKFAVRGYPTLILIDKEGEQHPYRGARDEDSLMAFVKNHAL
jgi:thioredoxin domain-containing protein 5